MARRASDPLIATTGEYAMRFLKSTNVQRSLPLFLGAITRVVWAIVVVGCSASAPPEPLGNAAPQPPSVSIQGVTQAAAPLTAFLLTRPRRSQADLAGSAS